MKSRAIFVGLVLDEDNESHLTDTRIYHLKFTVSYALFLRNDVKYLSLYLR